MHSNWSVVIVGVDFIAMTIKGAGRIVGVIIIVDTFVPLSMGEVGEAYNNYDTICIVNYCVQRNMY